MKILYIVGNRPQFIKLAVLHHEAKKRKEITEAVIHTGQHYSDDMSAVFFNELGIQLPVTNLDIHSFSHATMLGKMMKKLEPEITRENPDLVMVFGDTNTTLAGALTAKKLNIPIAHVEAGIRTWEEDMPEESNRYLTDRMSDYNFCCTGLNLKNLTLEGYNGTQIRSKVVYSGDVMLDAFHLFAPLFSGRTIPGDINIINNHYILFTLHRRQNIENTKVLSDIIRAVNAIHTEMPVICPLHPNTANIIKSESLTVDFKTISPVGYLDMQNLLSRSSYVITDSGGLQREAFFAKKPSLILMEKPFWPEVIEHGCSVSCDGGEQNILTSFAKLKQLKKDFNTSVFGNGDAAAVILQHLLDNVKKPAGG